MINLNLPEKAQSVLKTLCSNYRGNLRVKASFRCSTYYGLDKFVKEIDAQLLVLKKAGLILKSEIADKEIDDSQDLAYFTVYADMNLSLEDMANISANSQTVFIG